MDDRYARLESTVEGLRRIVESLEQRVAVLEAARPVDAVALGGAAAAMENASAGTQTLGRVRARRDPYDPIVVLSLIGRLFLVLAGGFFLRAMTEAGVLRAPVGIALAFLYALLWLVLADRSGRKSNTSSSTLFHVLGSVLVAFPLLIEATTRFKVIGVGGSVLGLLILTAAFMYVAVRRRLHAAAWIVVLAALPTSAVLLLKTGVPAPFALYLVALGVATLWLTYSLGWKAICWPAALAANLAVLGLALRALASDQPGAVNVALLLQVTLVAAYVGSTAAQTLLRDRKVMLFEIVQTLFALLIGFGGAIYLTRSAATVPALMGAASLLLGAGCYALAFRFVGRHEGHERNVQFYAALALVLVLAGLTLDLPVQWVGGVSAALAVLAIAGWRRYGRLYLLLHGLVYLVAAGVASHSFDYGAWALFSSPELWVGPPAAMALVVAAAALAAWLAASRSHPDGGVPASAMRLGIAIALVWTTSGWMSGLLAPALPTQGGGVNLGALATLRTGVLAAAALLVAWGARQERLREWVWLVYPLLVLVGLKMIAQDFKYSRPATLFIALALYGIALIIAPRLRRSPARTVPAADGRREPVAQVKSLTTTEASSGWNSPAASSGR